MFTFNFAVCWVLTTECVHQRWTFNSPRSMPRSIYSTENDIHVIQYVIQISTFQEQSNDEFCGRNGWRTRSDPANRFPNALYRHELPSSCQGHPRLLGHGVFGERTTSVKYMEGQRWQPHRTVLQQAEVKLQQHQFQDGRTESEPLRGDLASFWQAFYFQVKKSWIIQSWAWF